MTYHVIIQPQAEAEIEAAYLWKRDNAPQAAARWFAGIGVAGVIEGKYTVSYN